MAKRSSMLARLDRSYDDSDDASLDEMDGEAPQSPTTLRREDVLASFGYKAEKLPAGSTEFLVSKDGCQRCGKKVYPVERIDVGVVYHKNCFKCSVCSRKLTLKTFQLHHDGKGSKSKDVFCGQHVPQLSKANISQDALEIRQALNAQKQREVKRYEGEEYHLTPDDLQFIQSQKVKEEKRRKIKRHSSLRTYKDFELHGVFEAQKSLEVSHRKEEDELYSQIYDERQSQLLSLHEQLDEEKRRTVRQLIAWFEQKGTGKQERQEALRKIEEYYKQRRDERTEELLQRLAMEEQAAVARMIEKHSQEMLRLIADKDKEAEDAINEVTAQPPPSQDTGVSTYPNKPSKSNENLADIEIDVDVLPGGEMIVGKPRYVKSGQTQSQEQIPVNLQVQQQESQGPVQIQSQIPSRPHQSRSRPETERTEATSKGDDVVWSKKSKKREGSSRSADRLDETKKREEPRTESPKVSRGTHKKREKAEEVAKPAPVEKSPEVVHKTSRKSKKDGLSSDDSWEEDWENKLSELTERVTGKKIKKQNVRKKKTTKMGSHRLNDSTDEGEYVLNTMEAKSGFTRDPSPHSVSRQQRSQESLGSDLREGHSHESGIQEGYFQESWPSFEETGQPEILPPKISKSQLYKSTEVFSDLDKHAIKEAKRDRSTFTDLVRQLSVTCHSELERVRAIFRWVTAKDLNVINFDDEAEADSPMGLLRGIKTGAESYHVLFKRLCSYAGLYCEIIEGYSKGAGYRPGTKFRGDHFRNQWTAVCVDNTWRFINCNWGARHVKGHKDDLMTYKCDEFYFLTDPDQHIYQHFPDSEQWQLLDKPITMEEFIKLPVAKSPFFNSGLRFAKKYEAIVDASDGMVDLSIVTPHLMSFAAKLKPRDKRIPADSLMHRTAVRVIKRQIIINAILPHPGSYYIDIYASRSYGSESMDNICSFQIRSSEVSVNAQQTFPPAGCYGVSPAFYKFGLKEKTHVDPYISVKSGVDIGFTLSADVKLYHSLKLWQSKDKKMVEYDKYAFLKHRNDSSATFTISFSRRGVFVFFIYACHLDQPSSQMQCVYRYLIDCRAPAQNPCAFPKVSRRWRDCKLIEPLSGELVSRNRVRFTLDMPIAKEMVVSIEDKWYNLKKTEGRGLWQGLVYTGEKPSKAAVYCQLDATTEKYIPLLEYYIKEATVSDEVKQLYKYV